MTSARQIWASCSLLRGKAPKSAACGHRCMPDEPHPDFQKFRTWPPICEVRNIITLRRPPLAVLEHTYMCGSEHDAAFWIARGFRAVIRGILARLYQATHCRRGSTWLVPESCSICYRLNYRDLRLVRVQGQECPSFPAAGSLEGGHRQTAAMRVAATLTLLACLGGAAAQPFLPGDCPPAAGRTVCYNMLKGLPSTSAQLRFCMLCLTSPRQVKA